jgi:peroxiredoxin (alkyl hydroperoxide reductase subunit C)
LKVSRRCLISVGGKKSQICNEVRPDALHSCNGRFLIDPDGVVQAIEIVTPPVGRNVQELIRQIQAFQHVRKSKGTEATPSGWQPGRPTLKPGPDLVGKVWEVWKVESAF